MEDEGRKKAKERERGNKYSFPPRMLTFAVIFLRRQHWKGCYSF